ncbi:unnamed protein product [Ranitomeya imitator]|uniref:Parvalbumin n=1 Tax=Ranitomeya imitator TaxID=111125 RepID=A0ABN9M2U7_9NEOB|nr:unnamed protein product [Ranitomeya imitator]
MRTDLASSQLLLLHGFFKTLGLAPEDPAAQVKKVFDLLDRDNDGSLTVIDFEDFLPNFQPGARKLTPSETAAFMKAGDPNNTGKVSYAGSGRISRNPTFSKVGSSEIGRSYKKIGVGPNTKPNAVHWVSNGSQGLKERKLSFRPCDPYLSVKLRDRPCDR